MCQATKLGTSEETLTALGFLPLGPANLDDDPIIGA